MKKRQPYTFSPQVIPGLKKRRICVTCGRVFAGGTTAKYCNEHKKFGNEL